MQALDGRKAIPITPVQTEKYNKPTVAGPAYIGESEAQMDVAEQNGDSKEENKSKKDKKDKKEKKDKKKRNTTNPLLQDLPILVKVKLKWM